MTAEIAILNKSAVALAADSTVTVDRWDDQGEVKQKTYNTANKLFRLSKYHPVAVMIYGDPEFLGLPWETIIKVYRDRSLRKKSFPRLHEYALNLCSFLEEYAELFHEDSVDKTVHQDLFAYFRVIKESVERELPKDVTAKQRNAKAISVIARFEADLRKSPSLPNLSKQFTTRFTKEYADAIQAAESSIFREYKLSEAARGRLRKIAGHIYRTAQFPAAHRTGVVVAGFGEDDIFPAVVTLNPHVVIEGDLIYQTDRDRSFAVSHAEPSHVIPFAQTQAVKTFLNGLDPEIDGMLEDFFERLSAAAVTLGGGDPNEAQQSELAATVARLKQQLDKHVRTEHRQPLLDVVMNLPKNELAALAAALVNLESVKLKMSLDLETVGGPVDVAVLSKGDGFIWVSRKHYFSRDLNPGFVENYLADEDE